MAMIQGRREYQERTNGFFSTPEKELERGFHEGSPPLNDDRPRPGVQPERRKKNTQRTLGVGANHE